MSVCVRLVKGTTSCSTPGVKTLGGKDGRKPQIILEDLKAEKIYLLPWCVSYLGDPCALQGAKGWSSSSSKETQRKLLGVFCRPVTGEHSKVSERASKYKDPSSWDKKETVCTVGGHGESASR